MDRKDNQTPEGQIARILVEFFEVAVTSVVFLKGIYPNGAFERRRYMNLAFPHQGAFERRRYMNFVVHKARHPELNEYIHSAVYGFLPFLTKGVAVVFFDDGGVAIERFVFKVNVNQSYNSKVEEADLEFSLRSFLIKLPVSEPLTKRLRQNCRWEITAYFRALPQASSSKDAEMWIPSEAQQWQLPPLITPIKSMSSKPLGVQVYSEVPNLPLPEKQRKIT